MMRIENINIENFNPRVTTREKVGPNQRCAGPGPKEKLYRD